MKEMRRIIFFVFYDSEGIVDEYVCYLLKAMKPYVQRVVIISNSKLVYEGKERLKEYSDEIIERDNKGYDAGAYKDAFTEYYAFEKWEKWDEVILFNDTFYGPVYPMDTVFNIMDSREIDFWGMTRHEASKWSDGSNMKKHIQSYFIAFRKNVLLSDAFYDFWRSLPYPVDLDEAIHNYETDLTCYFENRGFLSGVFTDYVDSNYIIDNDECIYDKYIYELVSISKMPFIKRKALGPLNYTKASLAIDYIKNNTLYDVGLIEAHIRRLDKMGRFAKGIGGYGYLRIEEFNRRFKKIYLYGNGKIAFKLKEYYKAIGRNIDGTIVTDISREKGNLHSQQIIPYDSFYPTSDDGIVIATSSKYKDEILYLLRQKVSMTQILCPEI